MGNCEIKTPTDAVFGLYVHEQRLMTKVVKYGPYSDKDLDCNGFLNWSKMLVIDSQYIIAWLADKIGVKTIELLQSDDAKERALKFVRDMAEQASAAILGCSANDIEIELTTNSEYKDLIEGMCSHVLEVADRPKVGKDQTTTDAVGIVERVRVNQYGPGQCGDDYWGEIYIRVNCRWFLFLFSV